VTLNDWRNVRAPVLDPWYDAERRRWHDRLAWDWTPAWRAIEAGRASGRLPGFVALDERGAVQGVTFFSVNGGILRLGALSAGQATLVRELLDAVLAAPEASYAERYHAFVFPEAPSVASALERRRFAVEPYLYLERMLADHVPAPPAAVVPFRAWTDDDLTGAVRLLARAYAGLPAARSFAPRGRLDEWVQYATEIVRGHACGTFTPEHSVIAEGAEGMPTGLVLTSWLAEDTAHIAQIVVDPALRRHGMARRLVEHVGERAAATGASRLTLLVAASNAPARALYQSLGFVERASFCFADRDRITRTRAAAAMPATA
jgi:ribosomal protein S18 acetylase RimI-like enzyme